MVRLENTERVLLICEVKWRPINSKCILFYQQIQSVRLKIFGNGEAPN